MASDEQRATRDEAGRWLQRAREQAGYAKQADFARALGWDRSSVSGYEQGKWTMPDERAEQVADVLRMDVMEVRRGLGLWVPDDRAAAAGQPANSSAETAREMKELAQRLERMATDLLQQHQGQATVEPEPEANRAKRRKGA